MSKKGKRSTKQRSTEDQKIIRAAEIINVSAGELKRAIKKELLEETAEMIVETHYKFFIQKAANLMLPRKGRN